MPKTGTWVLRKDKRGKWKLVPKHLAPPQGQPVNFYVQSDNLNKPLIHPATGRTHDSKSAFRRDTKDSGCVEVGNDKPRIQTDPYKRMEPVQKDLYRAWDQLSR